MADYRDPNPVQQNDGSPKRWSNCTCAAAATSLDRSTGGKSTTTGGRVRELTGVASGGTTLANVDLALARGWGSDRLDVRYMMAFDDAMVRIGNGYGAILQVWYGSTFAGSALDGSPGFISNHAIYLNEVRIIWRLPGVINYNLSEALVYDPLWDGRRAGIPDRRFRWVPLLRLRAGAGNLLLGYRNGVPSRVGLGHCYVGFTSRTSPISASPVLPPADPITYGRNAMIVAGGLTLRSSHVMALKDGQSLYREPKVGASVVTKMYGAAKVDYFGAAASGWRAVLVRTRNFADRVQRPVLLYVPSSAGAITKKP